METYHDHYKKAVDYLKAADHLVYVTMPLVKDVKIIKTALDNINLALLHCMDAMLEYERYYRRVLPLANNFDLRFDVFRKRLIGRYGFMKYDAELIAEIKALVDERKVASMEFTKSGKYVMCSDTYNMRTISVDEIKKYLSTTKNFLMKADKVINTNLK